MPRTATVSRFYLQIQDGDQVGDVLVVKGRTVTTGTITEKSIIGRSDHIARTMQHGRIFLLGDAAHTISLAGGKGMNLAIADAEVLAEALAGYYRKDDEQPLANYTAARPRTRGPDVRRRVCRRMTALNFPEAGTSAELRVCPAYRDGGQVSW